MTKLGKTSNIDPDLIVASARWEVARTSEDEVRTSTASLKVLGGLTLEQERVILLARETEQAVTGIVGNIDQRTASIFLAPLGMSYDTILAQGPSRQLAVISGVEHTPSTFTLLVERLRAS